MLDRIDKELLTIIQADFPIDSRPYQVLGERLGISEAEVIERLQRIKDIGTIRRMGGIFDSKKVGYHSTLCAIKVPEAQLKTVADIINSYSGVTHNYIREHSYNMWFTLIAPSAEAAEDILAEIRQKTGIDELINLPAIKFFKVNVNFNINEV